MMQILLEKPSRLISLSVLHLGWSSPSPTRLSFRTALVEEEAYENLGGVAFQEQEQSSV